MAKIQEVLWYKGEIGTVFENLGSLESGLSKNEVKLRQEKFGLNLLPEGKTASLFVIFLRQFQSPLIYILSLACLVIFLLGDFFDALIILFVLLFNAIIGTIQEGRAQNTLQALKKFSETKATVLRDGEEIIVLDREIVPGDIILIQEGEKVPADARLIISQNLKVDEAAITGESEPVSKITEVLTGTKLLPAEQKNMLWKGTNIATGHGQAIVVATGLETLMGKIAKQVASIDTEIPLKKNIRDLSRLIIAFVVSLSVLIFLLGWWRGDSWRDIFKVVVSLAVSIIPEGLPIVMTLILATGVWRMSQRQALVKRLQAVEALGQAQVIAVDKTGTITKNELTVQQVYLNDKIFKIEGVGYEPSGRILLNGELVDPIAESDLALLGRLAGLSATARVSYSAEEKRWLVSGDPTEAAMLVLAQKIGFHRESLLTEYHLLAELPFDYHLKYHALAYEDKGGEKQVAVSGAPEAIIALCQKIWRDGQFKELDNKERQNLDKVFAELSSQGLRVIALAQKKFHHSHLEHQDISGLNFIGFLAMRDALREEVAGAMARAKAAGLRVIMITGDHKITATALAREAGIYQEGDLVLTGMELDTLNESDLRKKLSQVSVFSRVTPEHKMRIIEAFKKRGEIIAMTGDGVNDAPSLVAADLGVAMGLVGTEVAKEASDIVLLDDNFGSIISAIEEGRSIYKTIKKVILYLFAGSASQVFTILGAMFLGYPLPLVASQVIWLNFVTDGFLDVSLAMEPKEEGLLDKKFIKPQKYLVDNLMLGRILLMSLPLSLAALWLFNQNFSGDLVKASTLVLTALAVGHWFNAWSCRSEDKSVFQLSFWSNKFLLGTTVFIIGLQLLAIYHPFLQKILKTSALSLSDWLLIFPLASMIVFAEEGRKFLSK